MNYKLLVIFSLSFLLMIIRCDDDKMPVPANPFEITDDLGKTFTFKNVPERIITLAPNLTEIIFELGLGKKLIGNTLYCNYPDSANNVEKVGDLLTINFEKILKLKPDIIFLTVEGNTKEGYDKLIELGQRVFVSNPKNYDGIKKSLTDMGRIFNKQESVISKIDNWNNRVSVVKRAAEKKSPKTAMFLISLRPIMLAGKNTYINEFLSLCGLKNISEDTEVSYPIFNREQVLKRNPDYIIYTAGMNKDVETISSAYPEWKNINAVKNNNILFIDGDLYFRPGPRFILALEDLSSKVYGELN